MMMTPTVTFSHPLTRQVLKLVTTEGAGPLKGADPVEGEGMEWKSVKTRAEGVQYSFLL